MQQENGEKNIKSTQSGLTEGHKLSWETSTEWKLAMDAISTAAAAAAASGQQLSWKSAHADAIAAYERGELDPADLPDGLTIDDEAQLVEDVEPEEFDFLLRVINQS